MSLLREFLVSILAGYTFLALSNATRFRLRRLSGYHLLLWCSYAVPLALVVEVFLPPAKDRSILLTAGVSVGFIAAAALLAWLVNCVVTEDRGKEIAAEASAGAEIHHFLKNAMGHHDMTEVTLRTGKSYIGVPTRSPADLEGYIHVLPFLSGYRTDDQELAITSDYSWLYHPDDDEHAEPVRPTEDYVVLLRTTEVLMVRMFDPLVYRQPDGVRGVRTLKYGEGLPYDD